MLSTVAADVKSAYDSEFIDSVLELKVKGADFFDELNIHLLDIKSIHGDDSAIYKMSKAKLLYLRRDFTGARTLFDSIKKKDDLYYKSLRSYVKYSTLVGDKDGQVKSLKIFFADKKFYNKEVEGEDNAKYARDYLSLVTQAQYKSSAQTTLIKKIMNEKGWSIGPNISDIPRYADMIDIHEDHFLGESWAKSTGNKAELKEFTEAIDKLVWVDPKGPSYLLFLPYAARAKAILGNTDSAISSLNRSFPDIADYEKTLKKNLKKQDKVDWALYTPVPVTNYALAISYYAKAQQLVKAGKKKDALGYLLGKKGGSKKITNGALQLLFLLLKHPHYKRNDIVYKTPFKINRVVDLINKINAGKKQIKLPPFDGEVLGEAHFRVGNWAEAIEAYESFIPKAAETRALTKKGAQVGFKLVQAYAKLGKVSDLPTVVETLVPFAKVTKPRNYFMDTLNYSANKLAQKANASTGQEKLTYAKKRQEVLTFTTHVKGDTGMMVYQQALEKYNVLMKSYNTSGAKDPQNLARLKELVAIYEGVVSSGGTSKPVVLSLFKLAYLNSLFKNYDTSVKYYKTYYERVGNLTEKDKADKLDALSRIAKVEFSKEANSVAFKAASRRFKDEYKKLSSSLSAEKAKQVIARAKNRVDFIVIETANVQLSEFKSQLRALKTSFAKVDKTSTRSKTIKAKIEALNERIRKESAQSLIEYNNWLNANSGSNNYVYVLSKKADLLYVLGDKSSLVEAEKIEALLQANFPGSPIVKGRATKFVDIKIQEKDWLAAIEATKKIISSSNVEKTSDYVLDKLLRSFLFETKPSRKEMTADEFKAASMIANRCATLLEQRFAKKSDAKSQAYRTKYLFLKGKSFVYLKQSTEAKACFSQIIKANAKTSYLFDIKYMQAVIEVQNRSYAKAHKLLQEVIKLAQQTNPKRYTVLFKAYATEVAIYSASKNKKEIQAAFRMAELAKDIVVLNPKASEKKLLSKLQERVHYLWIINAAKLDLPFKEEQKRFVATYYSSQYLDAVRKAAQYKSTFK